MAFDRNTKRRSRLRQIKETLIADFISLDDSGCHALDVIHRSLRFKRKMKQVINLLNIIDNDG